MLPRQLPLFLIACTLSCEVRSSAPVKAVPIQLEPAHITFDLDASGLPSGFACTPALPPPTCATVTAAASRWKYLPGMSESKPAAMRVWMSLSLQAVPKSGGFALRATSVRIREAGSPAAEAAAAEEKEYAPPRYPSDAQRRGKHGLVVLELWFEPGSEQMSIRNVWLNGEQPRRRSDLVDAATAVARTWKAGTHSPRMLSVCIPVVFALDKPLPSQDTAPCQATYAQGYKPPELLTKPAQMVF